MKNYHLFILLTLLISLNTFVKAQNYYPLPDSNASWTVANYFDIGSNWTIDLAYVEIYQLDGDTIINQITYKKIYKKQFSVTYTLDFDYMAYFSAIRESNKKWYTIAQGSTSEVLLYNFDVNKGDSVTFYSLYFNNYYTWVVDSIDSILLNNNQYRKGIYLVDSLNGYYDYWVEGIGSYSYGLFFSAQGVNGMIPEGMGHIDLICFKDEGSYLISNSIQNPNDTINLIYSCDYITSINNTASEINYDITLFPNPVEKNEMIHLKANFKKDMIFSIYNLLGKKINSFPINSSTPFYLSKEGVYIYTLENSNEIVKTDKFIVR